ncbi:MAG TPA: hypothetical protein VHB20_03495 [Verrucomicrobiae bacterium]|jgi:hypothetical protein|nr:hypothetical protein [Verrucomicrobiae bacterium]
MNTTLPSSAASRARAGLTILEMLVSSAMLALIIVGLTAMFVQTQKAFKTGIKQTEVGDTGQTIADLISSDLAQLSDGTGFATNTILPGVTNLMWGWSNNYPQLEDGVAFRSNQLERIYMLVHTNTGWTAIGYAVSNVAPGIGVGTLYRYTSPINSHFFDNTILFSPFAHVFEPNFTNLITPQTRFSRIADGVVHLKIRAYDAQGRQVGGETNFGTGDLVGQITNTYPLPYNFGITNLPTSLDLEFGILEPDAWEHLKSLGAPAAQTAYLSTAASKIDIFRQRIRVRAATLP